MKYVLLTAALILSVGSGCFAGEETREDVEEAASGSGAIQMTQGPDIGHRTACRSNMMTIATSMEMYYATNGGFPSQLQDLEAFGARIFECPDHHIPYRLQLEDGGSSYTLTCPEVPSHGSVADGLASW